MVEGRIGVVEVSNTVVVTDNIILKSLDYDHKIACTFGSTAYVLRNLFGDASYTILNGVVGWNRRTDGEYPYVDFGGTMTYLEMSDNIPQ